MCVMADHRPCSTLILKKSLATLQRGPLMKTIKAFIKSHPLLSYFALTFAISWGGILLRSCGRRISATRRSDDAARAVLAVLLGPA